MNIRIPVVFVLVLGAVACASNANKTTSAPAATTASTAPAAATTLSVTPPSVTAPPAPTPEIKYLSVAPPTFELEPALEPAATAPQAPATPPAATSPVLSPPEAAPLNLTPYTSYKEITPKATVDSTYSGEYTRINIVSQVCDADPCPLANGKIPERYGYQNRSWITRYLFGKKFDFNMSVKIKIGDYNTTVPLVTIGHESDSNGEKWTRTISHQLLDYPLFLVRADGGASVPVFDINLAADKTVNSGMASALQVAVNGIQQVSPGAGVLTKLTAEATKTKADAIDTAISKLFSDGITEEHIAHTDLRVWNSADGIVITVQIPRNETDWNRDLRVIGTWTIRFEPPRPSIFSDWRACGTDDPEAVAKKIAAQAHAATAAAEAELEKAQDEARTLADAARAAPTDDAAKLAFEKVRIQEERVTDLTAAAKAARDAADVADKDLQGAQTAASAAHCTNNQDDALKYVHDEVTPASILNYTLIKNTSTLGTIQAYITQQDWYSTATAGFKSGATDVVMADNQKTAENICQKVESAVTSLGLNQNDAEMVIWAMVTGLSMPPNATIDAFAGSPIKKAAGKPVATIVGTCQRALGDVEANRRVHLVTVASLGDGK